MADSPRRILHLITRSQRRGAESAALDLSEALALRGYATRLVALAPARETRLDVTALGSRTMGPRTLLRLREEVRGADVVIAHGSRTLPAVVLAAAGLNRRLIYQNIGDPLFWTRGTWRRQRVRLELARMSAVAALTDQAAEVLNRHLGVPAERLHTIRNMRDGSRFRPPTSDERRVARNGFRLEAKDQVVAVIGALSPEKRVSLALEALAGVPDATVLVAGEGPQRAELERLAAVRGWDRARFLGALTDVVPLLHASDVLLMTSESEGVPGVLIEAGLCGVPAVSTDVGYVSDVIEQNESGILVASADPNEVRGAVERVLLDRERMGAAARDRCLHRFELSRVVDEWTRLLGPPTQ